MAKCTPFGDVGFEYKNNNVRILASNGILFFVMRTCTRMISILMYSNIKWQVYNTMILRETIDSFQYKIPVFYSKIVQCIKTNTAR